MSMYSSKNKNTLLHAVLVTLCIALCFGICIGCTVKAEEIEISVYFGEEKSIELSKPHESLNWSSEDTSVAIVNEQGTITGVCVGTTTITANEGEKTIAIVHVNVEEAKTEMTIDYGTENQMPSFASEKGLTWKSEDESIVTVNDSGDITGAGPGCTEIEVTKNGVCVAKISVTVNVIEPTAIFVSSESLEMEIEESTELTYMLMPETASDYGISWKSTNETVATVDETGKIQAVSEGNATIICSTKNGVMATCSVTVKPKSAIEQLNSDEKKLFDYMVEKWLPSFYNAPAVRLRNLYYGGGNGDKLLSVIVDVQGMNRLGGYVYKYYGIIITDNTGFALEAPDPDLSKPVPTTKMDYKKINAALEEYWNKTGAR